MGLESRDYVRSDNRGGWSGGPSSGLFSTAVTTLIVLNIAVYVLQLVLIRPPTPEEVLGAAAVGREPEIQSRVNDWCALSPRKVLGGQIWRLTTYDFLHDCNTPWHLVINMMILWGAGRHLESGVLGRREFLAFYLVAGVVSGLTYLVWGVAMGQGNPVVGASGAVVAVMIFYAFRYRDHVWHILGILLVPVIWIAALYVISDLFPVLKQIGGDRRSDGIAHAAHLGGMAFGFLCHRYDWRIIPWIDRLNWHPVRAWERWRARRRFRVVRDDDDTPPPPREKSSSLEKELDRVLAKVHESGQESLTEAERNILIEASRRYKKS